ncbi:hypothetical protein ACFSTC_41090 [Nonomuraea ferruginea]
MPSGRTQTKAWELSRHLFERLDGRLKGDLLPYQDDLVRGGGATWHSSPSAGAGSTPSSAADSSLAALDVLPDPA